MDNVTETPSPSTSAPSPGPPTATAAAQAAAAGVHGSKSPATEASPVVGGGCNSSRPYPPALATYEQVVSDVGLFMRTLELLHRSMGTKFMVPTIGGKALDLHRLFLEVTSRGGLEKAIAERKWRDVIAVFSFPPTITSASFVLRKYYMSLLHSYEQVYYFQNGQPNISSDDPLADTTIKASSPKIEPVTTPGNIFPESRSFQPGSVVSGTIKGKFDNGYLISASFGSEVLTGVLYHVPLESSEPRSISYALQSCGGKRSRKAMKDPSRPKSHRSGYNFFFAEQCAKLKPLYAREERAIRIADMWNKLNAEEKEVYQQKGVKDVERYRIEMLEYKKLNASRDAQYQ